MPNKAVILVGGASKGTRFRPLSLDAPKPLVPIGCQPLLYYHLKACVKEITDLSEIIILGFGEEAEFSSFIKRASSELSTNIRYLDEGSSLGTGGGLHKFKDKILEGVSKDDVVFVLHHDVLCSFPLSKMLGFHKKHGRDCTLLVKKVPEDDSRNYGCVVAEPDTGEVFHYAEKPETFVSTLANCGVYIFSPPIFDELGSFSVRRTPSTDKLEQQLYHPQHDVDDGQVILLEQHVFPQLAGDKRIFVYTTDDWWCQLKTAGMAVKCQAYIFNQCRMNGDPEKQLATGPNIIGNVTIHPSAQVDSTAKLGPNVSIGANAVIGKGARIVNSLVLDGAEIKAHACVLYSIIGWNSVVGEWTRIEGSPEYQKTCGITLFGAAVTAAAEIMIRNCVVLPHKLFLVSIVNEVVL